MKTLLSVKCLTILLLALFFNSALIAQSAIDPEAKDPDYQLKKARTGNVTQGSDRKTKQNKQADFGCNVNNSCFIPLDGNYIELPRNDDGSYGPIDLPFTFDLYGSQYHQVYINTNGNLTFIDPYSGYVAEGFPIGTPMVAAFWTDVDTRNFESGAIYYQMSSTHLIVTWDGVGYYNSHADKLNTFQIVIGTLGDPLLGGHSNVKFAYETMQWTVPDGSALFGPATVGINKGDNNDFVQVGRFDKENCDYDGSLGETDGIGYLENQCFLFNVSSGEGNFPPVVSGLPANDSIVINVGDTANLSVQFIGPEADQVIVTEVNAPGLCSTDVVITNGSVSKVDLQVVGANCNVGTHIINFKATDNGVPPLSTAVNLTVVVKEPVVDTACKNICITDNFGYAWALCYKKQDNFNKATGTVSFGDGTVWNAHGWMNCNNGIVELHAVNPNADGCASGYTDSFIYRGYSAGKCNMADVHVANGRWRSFCSGAIVGRGDFNAVNCGGQAAKIITNGNATPARIALADIALKVSPNPVRNSASISYTLSKESKVTVVVYNYMMQPVNTLVNGTVDKGSHSVTWDGKSSGGALAGNGLYKIVATVNNQPYSTTVQVIR